MIDPPSARPRPKPNFTADSYFCNIGGWRKYTAAETEGHLLLSDGDFVVVRRVLFDSGALHSSYISSKLVDKNIDILKNYLSKTHGRVMLGDNKTEIKVDQVLRVPVRFLDDNQIEHIATVDLVVFPMDHLDIIIGLPDILGPYFPFFFSLLSGARKDSDADQQHVMDDDIIYPWTQPLIEEALEEEIVPLPCCFPFALHVMSKSYDELMAEFIEAMDKQVSPEVRESHPKLMDLIRNKGAKVFIPVDPDGTSNWKGINGFEPISIPVREDMPKEHRCKARRINPRLYENAKKEYDRLLGYFYVKSTSSIASPLVIAPKNTSPWIRFCGDHKWVNQYILPLQYHIPIPQDEIPKAARFKVFADIDLTNAFHQLILAEETSNMLTVMTPWGSVRPRFLPEGVTPASAILQKAVASIFAHFSECVGWSSYIWVGPTD